jgi:ATP-dependent helicase YprA (DUF1998 family)
MSELLPTIQADRIRSSLVDYLTTTFALSDAEVRDGLDRFLSDPASGMFKGPYVRLRLPFRPAAEGWRESLEWYVGPTPYGHQAAAFRRLSSSIAGQRRRPEPTLVTTGTGSGKTEAFLYPIVDHVLRAKRDGVTGTKALILYPMNALANDQAKRLTELLTTHAELGAVTAALYTGQDGPKRTSVTSDGLITDRAIIRDSAPDILLTNYKMLDQMLLRHEDQELWRQSATSLQYLVLDEFHTYDGAQGTDVAMLLRRLGLALKSHWREGDPAITADDWARPLGRITPVATSATLGDKGDPDVMLGFAEAVFGEDFGTDAVVTESRLDLAEWVADADTRIAALGLTPIDGVRIDLAGALEAIEALGPDPAGKALAPTVLRFLFDGNTDAIAALDADELLALTRAHPLVQRLAAEAGDALALDDLVARTAGDSVSFGRHGQGAAWVQFLGHVVAALGHVRKLAGRGALSVDAHLWVRELTRIDRSADTTATFRWGDDGPPTPGDDHEEIRPSFPAIYCRHCGRSGWGIGLSPVGDSLASEDEGIRRNHAQREGRFRALMHAPTEAEDDLRDGGTAEGLVWFSVRGRTLERHRPAEDDPELVDGWYLPVLTVIGSDADEQAKDDTCPACGQADGIRFLGSAIATLLSVSLSTLFGSASLESNEKKALVFTDSVQDAAHRAGFVQARSHVLTLRGVLRASVAGGALSLDQLVEEVIRDAGDDPFARYRILPPDCADRASFESFWSEPKARAVAASVRTRVRTRLALDIALEFGLNSRLGRTLELTGSVAAEVDAGQPLRMAGVARVAIEDFTWQESTDGAPGEATLIGWVRGVLDRMRSQGAITHPWFDTYLREDGNRWRISGGRPRNEGMPAFPPGRPAPGYPRVGGHSDTRADSGLDPVTSPKSWYAIWTSRMLSTSATDGGKLARLLLDRLAHDGVIIAATSQSGATIYALRPERIIVSPTTEDDLAAQRHLLACETCHATTPGSTTTVDQLDGAPCLVVRCRGRLRRAPLEAGFYRNLYRSPDMRRVVAREHTSLLDDAERLAYETGFKAPATNPQSPNVLVATPTLEMGIDIGDLSAVMLASLPRTVASYLQRVGRAGRLTGNALNLAYVTGRGDQLPKIGDPLSVINGEVRPPATYLQAEEILRRQYLAHLVDCFARDVNRPHPNSATGALGSSDPDSFLGDLIAYNEASAEEHVARFSATFGARSETIAAGLRDWAQSVAGPRTSGLSAYLQRASGRWQTTVETLVHRLESIDAVIPELTAKHDSPAATDDDHRALRSAQAARKLTAGQLHHLRGAYWISNLEEHGVLPNYTLLDDAVMLDVGVSWIDPDTNTYRAEHAQISRGARQAIREFAPGATFYGRGWEIAIDAVDLGVDGGAIRPWVFCPACGYAQDVEPAGHQVQVPSCPRCGSTGIADTGQRLDVVELTHVTAEVRHDEATISDRRDERTNRAFQIMLTADVDESQIAERWYVDQVGLGCTYVRATELRWINLGAPGHGSTRTISGEERNGALFRVCEGCGKLDIVAGRNLVYEHRPWCKHRSSAQEHNVSIALSRTLRTQGLLVRLPYAITLGDDFAVPSLSAALLLGLREQLGGHPDHIAVERVVEPTDSDGSDNHDAILLHDVVPGGTGYLAEMADPDRMRDLLVRAWVRVRDCECRHEERLACHRCLLPFVPPSAIRRVSRAAAERHLRTLLGVDADATTAEPSTWQITTVPPVEDVESQLEQQFRKLMIKRLATTGAAVHEIPGAWGNTIKFTLAGDTRQWTLTPQVNVENSKPDFVLQSTDTNVPTVAIFTDGRTYHATEAHNRLADDAAKREILRGSGRVVLGICAQDLTREQNDEHVDPPWYSADVVSKLISQPSFQTTPAAYESLRRGPIDWLIGWVTSPAPAEVTTVARAVPVLLQPAAQIITVPDDAGLAQIARDVLTGSELAGTRKVALFRDGALAVVIEPVGSVISAAVVLDDRPGQLTEEQAKSWRLWLRLSNALALRDWPTAITTVTRVAAEPIPVVADVPAERPELAQPWADIYDAAADGAERELVVALAGYADLGVPEVGAEGPDGIMLDLSWPELRIVVDVHGLPEQDRADLVEAGWTVLPADAGTIAGELVAAATDGEG